MDGLQAELLRNDFMPTDDEIAAITERVEAGQKLAPLDVFLHKLAQVPRGKEKLSMIMQMETVADAAEQIVPKAMSVQLASNSLLSSTKLQKVLEVVLAFGNHMNSGRRGGAWGFKLSVFDQLLNTKTADRRMNLMHFVESTVRATSPESVAFASELVDIQVAGSISLTGLQQELDQARNVMNKVEKECADPEAARELFHQISLVSPPFFARALWQIALPPLGGVAAICQRPLGVWHPKKSSET
jgi:hypothetical protein